MNKKRIKILSPIDRLEEALPLIKAGADEFYCGVVMEEENFGSIRFRLRKISENKYDYSSFNIPTIDEFEKLVKLLKKNRKKIFLVMNGLIAKRNRLDILNVAIDKIKKMDLDGIIINDLRLTDIFKKAGIKMVASSFLSAINKESIEYLIRLGFKRIILERQITLDELELITNYPKIEFETFIMNSGCRSLSIFCSPGVRYKVGKKFDFPMHPCHHKYQLINRRKGRLSIQDKKTVAERLTVPDITCGACAIYQFDKYGVDSLKIVGRSFPTDEKVAAVKFVRRCLDLLDKHKDKKTYYFHTRKLFESTFHKKCNFEECYYPHFLK